MRHFEMLKENTSQPGILYRVKICFKNKDKTENICHK